MEGAHSVDRQRKSFLGLDETAGSEHVPQWRVGSSYGFEAWLQLANALDPEVADFRCGIHVRVNSRVEDHLHEPVVGGALSDEMCVVGVGELSELPARALVCDI